MEHGYGGRRSSSPLLPAGHCYPPLGCKHMLVPGHVLDVLDVLAWSLTNSLGDPEWLGPHPCQGEGGPLDLSLSASGTKGALLQLPTLIFRYIFSFSHTHTPQKDY